MFNKLSPKESYWGEVVLVDDETQSGRIKVSIPHVYGTEISTEDLPWALLKFPTRSSLDLPYVGEIVEITFKDNNRYYPLWNRFPSERDNKFNENDYPSSSIIIEKDLKDYGLDGNFRIYYSESGGINIHLTKEDYTSIIKVAPDHSISLSNGNTNKHIHISKESISLGSLEKSEYSGTLGEPTNESLDSLNDMVKQLAETLSDGLKQIGTAASSSPYTAALAGPTKALGIKVKTETSQTHQKNKDLFPSILSKLITLDKE